MLQNEFSECSQPVIAERGGQAPAQAAGWRDWQVLARPGGVYRRPHTQDPDAAARRPPPAAPRGPALPRSTPPASARPGRSG